ncbi:hypothetical protein D3C79_742980 [compost metagenome]
MWKGNTSSPGRRSRWERRSKLSLTTSAKVHPTSSRAGTPSQRSTLSLAWRIRRSCSSSTSRKPCGWMLPGTWIGSWAQRSTASASAMSVVVNGYAPVMFVHAWRACV